MKTRGNAGQFLLESPLKEAARNIGFANLGFGTTTALSCLRIWLETIRDQPVPTLPM